MSENSSDLEGPLLYSLARSDNADATELIACMNKCVSSAFLRVVPVVSFPADGFDAAEFRCGSWGRRAGWNKRLSD